MRAIGFLNWYEELLAKVGAVTQHSHAMYGVQTVWYEDRSARAWASEAASALAAVFPPGHPIRLTWASLEERLKPGQERGGSLEEMIGVFQAATQQLRDNRLGTLLDAVRAETVDELLDQASALLGARHVTAAAVIAGGALETHLRHLVTKHELAISGDGSISKYDGAIAKARNDGTSAIYSAVDSKLIGAWGGIRNEAAHSPSAFSRTPEEVRRMIDGVREFIVRTI